MNKLYRIERLHPFYNTDTTTYLEIKYPTIKIMNVQLHRIFDGIRDDLETILSEGFWNKWK